MGDLAKARLNFCVTAYLGISQRGLEAVIKSEPQSFALILVIVITYAGRQLFKSLSRH